MNSIVCLSLSMLVVCPFYDHYQVRIVRLTIIKIRSSTLPDPRHIEKSSMTSTRQRITKSY